MSKTPSQMIALGTKAPAFRLFDVISETSIELNEHSQAKAFVLCFICNHCPYVKYINSALVAVANHYMKHDILFIAISSNDVSKYPDDSPEEMKKTAQQEAYPFAYLYDDTQEVAKAYHAACTPDFFVFNEQQELIYRGQFDDSRPGNEQPVTGKSLSHALDCVLNNSLITTNQKPSLGCNIKWKD